MSPEDGPGRWRFERVRLARPRPLAVVVSLALVAAAVLAPASLAGAGGSPALTGKGAQMLNLVNAERQRYGVRPLVYDPVLASVAEAHARDMIGRGYFGHISPRGTTPAARAGRAGLRFSALGENLAGDTSVADAHRLLVASPPHRANLLNAAYTRMGVSVVEGGPYGLMIVELFFAPAADLTVATR